jgi:hypothetical protein
MDQNQGILSPWWNIGDFLFEGFTTKISTTNLKYN